MSVLKRFLITFCLNQRDRTQNKIETRNTLQTKFFNKILDCLYIRIYELILNKFIVTYLF